MTIYTENLADIAFVLPKLHRRDVADLTFSIGEWVRQRKEKRQVLVEANKSIQDLEGKITELKRKVRSVVKIIEFWFSDYLLILKYFSSKETFRFKVAKYQD